MINIFYKYMQLTKYVERMVLKYTFVREKL